MKKSAMKMVALLLLLMVALLCGCSKASDPRTGELLTRVSNLEANVAELQDALIRDNIGRSNLTWLAHGIHRDLTNYQEVLLGLSLTIANHIHDPVAHPTNRFMARSVAQASSNQNKEGIPLNVYNQIATDAAKQWPGNYRMQSYEIRTQVEAYKKLH